MSLGTEVGETETVTVEQNTAPVASTAHTEEKFLTAPEALGSAVRRAAAADGEYQRWLQEPPPGTRINNGLLFDEQGRMRIPVDAALRTAFERRFGATTAEPETTGPRPMRTTPRRGSCRR